ncbi:Tn3 family transposase, partial [Providencia huaxiensis]|uniref:Tn3 family transposase n=1 Tax=Providencia huaxiensis TaxID=2027290 RepID=UPI0034E56FC7
ISAVVLDIKGLQANFGLFDEMGTQPLSRLLERLEAEGNTKGIDALTRISPVAWQHILLNGHYTFQNSNEIIDLDELVAGLKLG